MVEYFEAGNIYRNENLDFDVYALGVLSGSETDHVTLSTLRIDRDTGQTSIPEEIDIPKSEFKDWSLL